MVLSVGPKEQVFWIHASRNIAPVENVKFPRNRSEEMFPTHSVSVFLTMLSVPLGIGRTLPDQTRAEIGDIDDLDDHFFEDCSK